MNTYNEKKIISNRVKLSPLKISNLYTKNNSSESKKEENTSKSYLNSVKYLTTFDDSSLETKKLHIITKPYKIFLPIRTKMRKIKNKRLLSLNNYYKKTLKNDLISKERLSTESVMNSEEIQKKKQNNTSKNMAITSTERTITTKDLTLLNVSHISKINNYNKYNIFAYNNKSNLYNINKKNKNQNNNTIFNNTNTNKKTTNNNLTKSYNDYKPLRFLNFNQGYKNLPSLKNCINHFTNEIKNLTRETYMNYCLQEKKNTALDYLEFHDNNYKMEMKKKSDNKDLFDIFYKDYNIYYNQIKKKEEKDYDKRSLLNWEIISYKNDVNRLNIKKDKLLARLNKYIKMKQFLIKMRNYSLDKKDDSWMFEKFPQKEKNLLKNRRIKVDNPESDNENSKTDRNFRRRGSVELNDIGKLNEIKIKKNNKSTVININRRLKRLKSQEALNPLLGSGMKETANILNNHITNLLIYQNQLRIELEPLKEEFNEVYKSLKESDEKKNKLLKLQFLIFPEKKRIAKERNEFLSHTLINIKNNIYNSSKYNKLNKKIKEKLYIIYKTLLNNNIIPLTRMKASLEGNVVETIFFYLKNIEQGLNKLFANKKIMQENYPKEYNDVIQDINEILKIKALEMQRQKYNNKLGRNKINEIVNKMNKTLILNRRKDYYKFGYKKSKKKIKIKKIDPYDELKYSDDNNSEGEDEKKMKNNPF